MTFRRRGVSFDNRSRVPCGAVCVLNTTQGVQDLISPGTASATSTAGSVIHNDQVHLWMQLFKLVNKFLNFEVG